VIGTSSGHCESLVGKYLCTVGQLIDVFHAEKACSDESLRKDHLPWALSNTKNSESCESSVVLCE
jgi:hypothetical protein